MASAIYKVYFIMQDNAMLITCEEVTTWNLYKKGEGWRVD